MSDDDKKPSGNASLLAQLSELQELESEYGRDTTAKFLKRGLKRSLDVDVSTEKSEGFLEISQALQRGDARVGYLVKDEEDKAAKAATEISKKLVKPDSIEVDEDEEEFR
jgi:hypothetical protein